MTVLDGHPLWQKDKFLQLGLSGIAPAKINLALHVTGQRSDGYHLLETLVAFSNTGDQLTVKPASRDVFTVTGPFASGIPANGENSVLRALDLLREKLPSRIPPVAIELEKNLPPASGIGGGSSDAAAAIRLLCRLWSLPLDDTSLRDMALPLGADLPMCLTARPLIASGIGEVLRDATLPAMPMVIVNPGIPVATPSIFRALRERENPPLPPLPEARTVPALATWLQTTRNDLQEAAISVTPEIAGVLEALERENPLVARMSGSGATCFGLFETLHAARTAADVISTFQPGWFVLATSTMPSPMIGNICHEFD